MHPFALSRADDPAKAIAAHAVDNQLDFIAGGTDPIGLMKDRAALPERLLDINGLPDLARIESLPGGGLRIGALARMSDVAASAEVRRHFPVITEALLFSASVNFATWPRWAAISCSYEPNVLTGPPRMLNGRALVAAGGDSLRSSSFGPCQRGQAGFRFGAKRCRASCSDGPTGAIDAASRLMLSVSAVLLKLNRGLRARRQLGGASAPGVRSGWHYAFPLDIEGQCFNSSPAERGFSGLVR